MIADLVDDAAVHVADLADVRRVNHDFAAIGDDRLGLVHAFRGRPEVVVHRRHHREHALERPIDPDDVTAGGERGRLPPRLARVAAVQRPPRPSCVTTSARSDSGVDSSAAARSITARTGVSMVPMTL